MAPKHEKTFEELLNEVPTNRIIEALKEKQISQKQESTKKIAHKRESDFHAKIDLHGARRHIAILRLREFLENCIKYRKEHVLIIHGKGSGALREEVLHLLENNPQIISIKQAKQKDGGEGAIEVYLRLPSRK